MLLCLCTSHELHLSVSVQTSATAPAQPKCILCLSTLFHVTSGLFLQLLGFSGLQLLAPRHPPFCSTILSRDNFHRHARYGLAISCLAFSSLWGMAVHLFRALTLFPLMVDPTVTLCLPLIIQPIYRPYQPPPSFLKRNFPPQCQSSWPEFLALLGP